MSTPFATLVTSTCWPTSKKVCSSEQVTTAAEHLDGCAECRAQSQALDDVRAAAACCGADADDRRT